MIKVDHVKKYIYTLRLGLNLKGTKKSSKSKRESMESRSSICLRNIIYSNRMNSSKIKIKIPAGCTTIGILIGGKTTSTKPSGKY